jgi:hypothetical protein
MSVDSKVSKKDYSMSPCAEKEKLYTKAINQMKKSRKEEEKKKPHQSQIICPTNQRTIGTVIETRIWECQANLKEVQTFITREETQT